MANMKTMKRGKTTMTKGEIIRLIADLAKTYDYYDLVLIVLNRHPHYMNKLVGHTRQEVIVLIDGGM